MVASTPNNMKITKPTDYYVFRALYEAMENQQILAADQSMALPRAVALSCVVAVPHVLRDDVETALNDPAIRWDRFRGATILVTGATGQSGTGSRGCSARPTLPRTWILPWWRRDATSSKGRRLEAELDARFLAADVRELSPAASGLDNADFVFHAPGVTSSAHMVARPEEVLATAVEGTRNVLDLAVGTRGRQRGLRVVDGGLRPRLDRRGHRERPGDSTPTTLAAATRRESGGPRR